VRLRALVAGGGSSGSRGPYAGPMRHRSLVPALVAAVVATTAAPAGAAQRLETITTPSVNVDPRTTVFNGTPPEILKANVLLPDGYDDARAFPVVFLLHGVGDTYDSWRIKDKGDIQETAKGLGAIVVMPEAGKGFYTNWFNGGRRGAPGWERYFLDELIPQIEARYRVAPGRRNHAIAGLSMGGFGAAYLATQRPDYFGSSSVFSGFVQHQRPEVEAGLRAVGGVEYQDIFGPMDGAYATGHNPTRIPANLRHTRLFVAVGDGTPVPGVQSSPTAIVGGGAVEAGLRQQTEEFVAAARTAGVETDYRPGQGVHDWPYWRGHLRAAIAHDLFAPVPEDPDRWSYETTATTGRMWSLGYAFAAPPTEVVRFVREGATLRGSGSGSVTVKDIATGCTFTATLPFAARALPGAPCGSIEVRVLPRHVRRGRLTRVRVSAVAVRDDGTRTPLAGARVLLGAARRRTDARGGAVVRLRFVGRPGLRRVAVRAAGLRGGVARLRVR